MKQIILSTLLALTFISLGAISASAKTKAVSKKTSNSSIICSYDAYNCTNFKTRAEATKVFTQCGGVKKDIHRLDADKDGIACENLK